ncbi:MAG: hypothetical protein QM767_27790 [Anaeromyxobacter sp.]
MSWSTCAGCGLKHTLRPDGLCPRCGKSAGPASPELAAFEPPPFDPGSAPGAAAPLPPGSAARPRVAVPRGSGSEEEPAPLAWRAAGLILLANTAVAVFLLIKTGLAANSATGVAVVAPVVDLFLGGMLLAGKAHAQPWALARAILGGVLLTVFLWTHAGPMIALLQLTFSAGMVALLLGAPGALRGGAGGLLASSALTLGLLAATVPAVEFATEGVVADVLDGRRHCAVLEARGGHLRLPLPEGRWHLRANLAPSVDAAAIWPEEGAVAMLNRFPTPGPVTASLEELTDGAVSELEKRPGNFRELERMVVEVPSGRAMAIHAAMTQDGRELQGWVILGAGERQVVVVLVLALAERFEPLQDELLELASAAEYD